MTRRKSGPLGTRPADLKGKPGDWHQDRDKAGHIPRQRTADLTDDQLDGHPLGRAARKDPQ